MNGNTFDAELGEWSRHYDKLLWQVTTLLATADGALLIFCVEKDRVSVIPYVIGLLLPPIAVYFAASFREFKNELATKMSKEFKANVFFRRRLWQWEAYVAIFFFLTITWMWLLLQRSDLFFWWGFVGGIVSVSAVVGFWLFSRSQTTRAAQHTALPN